MSKRLFAAPLLCCAILLAGAGAARAASPIQFLTTVENDPETAADDTLEAVSLHWNEENMPIEYVLQREFGSEIVLLPNSNPDEMDSGDVRDAIERALEEWNEVPGSGLRFDESVRYSDLVIDDRFPFGPDRVQLDGHNLITFIEPVQDFTEFDDGGFATTSIFFFVEDVDLSDGDDPLLAPFVVGQITQVDTDGHAELGDLLTQLDFDGDGEIDFNLEQRAFPAGEIIDADIIFNQSADFRNIPEDEDDLETSELEGITSVRDALGLPDIQALATRELIYSAGSDSSLIPTSILYSIYASRFDPEDGTELDPDEVDIIVNPFTARDLSNDLEARVTAATLYPGDSSEGTGGITGTVFDGADVDHQPGEDDDADDLIDPVLQYVPIFVGRPVGAPQAVSRTMFQSDRGLIELQAGVFSGLGLHLPADNLVGLTRPQDGSYIFRGLPPASNYGVRLSDNIDGFEAERGEPNLLSEPLGDDSLSDTGDIPEDNFDNSGGGEGTLVDDSGEWHGGAGFNPIFTVNNLSSGAPNDFRVANSYLTVAGSLNGTIEVRVTNAEYILPRNTWSMRVQPASGGVIESSSTFGIFPFGFLEDDENDILTISFVDATGSILATRIVEITDLDGDGIPAEVLSQWQFQNFTAEPITFGFAELLGTAVTFRVGGEDEDGDGEPDPGEPAISIFQEPLINGVRQILTGQFPVPSFFQVVDNYADPLIRAIFNLIGPNAFPAPTRFQFVFFNDYVFESNGSFSYQPESILTPLEPDLGRGTRGAAPVFYWEGFQMPVFGSANIQYDFGVVEYYNGPETGQPLPDDVDVEDDSLDNDPDILDDNPYISTPVRVSAGSITRDIHLISNTGERRLLRQFIGVDVPVQEPPVADPDPSDNLPPFDDLSPANGGDAVPLDDLFVFGAVHGDVDNDGDLDLFIPVSARGETESADGAALANRLYLNRLYAKDARGVPFYTGRIGFDDATFGADGAPGTSDDRIPFQPSDASYTAELADFDADGDLDVYIANWAGSGGQDTTIGRQNRILINRNLDLDGDGDAETPGSGFFDDRTNDFEPGIHNSGAFVPHVAAPIGPVTVNIPNSGSGRLEVFEYELGLATVTFGSIFDITTSVKASDLNGDTFVDLVVGNRNIWSDSVGSLGIRSRALFSVIDAVSEAGIFDPGQRPIYPGELNIDYVFLFASERLLINQGFDPETGEWLGFRDETLGADNLFGGGPASPVSMLIGDPDRVEGDPEFSDTIAAAANSGGFVFFTDGFEETINTALNWEPFTTTNGAGSEATGIWHIETNSVCLGDTGVEGDAAQAQEDAIPPLDPNQEDVAFVGYNRASSALVFNIPGPIGGGNLPEEGECFYLPKSMGVATTNPIEVPTDADPFTSIFTLTYYDFIMNIPSPVEQEDPPPWPIGNEMGDEYAIQIAINDSDEFVDIDRDTAAQIFWARKDYDLTPFLRIEPEEGEEGLPTLAETFQLRFEFIGTMGNGRGWFIDDVVVRVAGLPSTLIDDRLPPLYMDYRTEGIADNFDPNEGSDPASGAGIGPNNFELDGSDTAAIALAPLTFAGGTSLDIYVADRRDPGTAVNGFRAPYTKWSGNNEVYANLNVIFDFFGVPDGYFQYYNAGDDYEAENVLLNPETGSTTNLSTQIYVRPSGVSTGIAGVVKYEATALNVPFGRFEDDAGGEEGGDDGGVDFILQTLSHTVDAAVGDFDYRGVWQVFNANVNDGGLNHDILRPLHFPTTPTVGGVNRQTLIGFVPGTLGGEGSAYLSGPLPSRYETTRDDAPAALFDDSSLPVFIGRATGAETSDFNRDGDLDIVITQDTRLDVGVDLFVTSPDSGQIIYLDNGDSFANFTNVTELIFDPVTFLGSSYSQLTAADFDNDGDEDFIAYTVGQGIRPYYNSLFTGGPNPLSIDDFFTFYDATNKYLHPFIGTGISTTGTTRNRINQTTSAAFADINADGYVDLAIGRGGFNTVQGDQNDLYLNVGAHRNQPSVRVFKPAVAFYPQPAVLVPSNFGSTGQPDPTVDLHLADFTGDGFPDMLVLNRSVPSELYWNEDAEDGIEISLDLNGDLPDGLFRRVTGPPTFALPFPVVGDENIRLAYGAAIANLNPATERADEPGKLDIVIANGPFVRNLLFLNEGNGIFAQSAFGLPSLPLSSEGGSATVPHGNDSRAVAAADFDGDGDIDLFFLNRFEVNGSGSVSKVRSRLFLNQNLEDGTPGSGEFVDATFGADRAPDTSDDRVPLITGEVTSVVGRGLRLGRLAHGRLGRRWRLGLA
jgi:hypothetical protein